MSASVELLCVPPDQVAQFWPFVCDLIGRAVQRTNLNTLQDIERETLRGNGLLWLAVQAAQIRAAATTVLQRTDRELVCIVTAAAGEGCDWKALMGGIESYAVAEGCGRMRLFGRKGWERVLDGFHVQHVILEKGLS